MLFPQIGIAEGEDSAEATSGGAAGKLPLRQL